MLRAVSGFAVCGIMATTTVSGEDESMRQTVIGAVERCVAAIRTRSAEPFSTLPTSESDEPLETPGVEVLSNESFIVMPQRITATFEVTKRDDSPVHHTCSVATHALSRDERDAMLDWFDDWAREQSEQPTYLLDPDEPNRAVLHGCFGADDRLVADASWIPVSPAFIVIGYSVNTPLPGQSECLSAQSE